MKKAKYITANRRQRGFTMIELMITITLVAILASIAVPSMRTYVLNSRISSTSQELLRTLQTSRSEAIKRQHNVVVCASANPQATDASTVTCTTGSPSPIGWIMFEDYSTDTATTNSDWVRDSTEPLIEIHSFESGKMKLLLDGSKRIAYKPSGFVDLGTSTAPKIRSTGMVICDSRGNVDSSGGTSGAQSVARGIFISDTGRPRLTRVRNSSTDSHDISELLTATGSSC